MNQIVASLIVLAVFAVGVGLQVTWLMNVVALCVVLALAVGVIFQSRVVVDRCVAGLAVLMSLSVGLHVLEAQLVARPWLRMVFIVCLISAGCMLATVLSPRGQRVRSRSRQVRPVGRNRVPVVEPMERSEYDLEASVTGPSPSSDDYHLLTGGRHET